MSTFERFVSTVFFVPDVPKNRVIVSGQIVLGQLAQIQADHLKDGAKKNLFHALVHLDEKQFLKPDFGYSKENVAELSASSSIKSHKLTLDKKKKKKKNSPSI